MVMRMIGKTRRLFLADRRWAWHTSATLYYARGRKIVQRAGGITLHQSKARKNERSRLAAGATMNESRDRPLAATKNQTTTLYNNGVW